MTERTSPVLNGQLTPYFQDDLVTLYLGDCEAVLPTLGEFDLIFTSPPYNIGGLGHYKDGGGKWNASKRAGGLSEGYDGHDDRMPPEEYEAWQKGVLRLCWDHLTNDGAIFYNHKPRVQGTVWWSPLSLNPGLPIRQVVIWSRGHGLNQNPTSYMPTHEWIVIFAKDAWRLREQSASGVGDVWLMEPEHGNPHPAPFPVRLPARAIETVAPSRILDPFAGSGTTLIAARESGVRAVGIEKSERYCEMAVNRLNQGSLFGVA